MSTPLKIYVASSWRNQSHPKMVSVLRELGYHVYDFQNAQTPEEIEAGIEGGDKGFHWKQIDPNWENWSAREFRDALFDPRAVEGHTADMAALEWADVVVLLLPCGKSAHLEAGYAAGLRKTVIAYVDGGEPELMYRLFDAIAISETELAELLRTCQEQRETSTALKGTLMEED